MKNDKEPAVPESPQVIEPERMSETETRRANSSSGRRSRRVFIRESPYGTQFTHIEVDEAGFGPLGAASPFAMPKPPKIATWICLIAAWLFLGSALPFTVFIGFPVNVAALVLALACLTRGGVVTGIVVLLLGTAGSFIVYLTGLLRFLSS